MENSRVLPFNRINSDARFVVYSESEGVISEHERAGLAMRGLSERVLKKHDTKARIYERTPEGWEAIL